MQEEADKRFGIQIEEGDSFQAYLHFYLEGTPQQDMFAWQVAKLVAQEEEGRMAEFEEHMTWLNYWMSKCHWKVLESCCDQSDAQWYSLFFFSVGCIRKNLQVNP